jgi:hypothetical protein
MPPSSLPLPFFAAVSVLVYTSLSFRLAGSAAPVFDGDGHKNGDLSALHSVFAGAAARRRVVAHAGQVEAG